ncbi:MAG: methyltransferase domain-containing protein [Actinobacteria bacterium]|nr:methyltransferase domain-containing protein [Actinomycetota bacterium]
MAVIVDRLRRRPRPASSSGLRTALRLLRNELRIALLHQMARRRARALAGERSLKIQLGCGPKPKPGWVNVDMVPQADFQLDLRKPLPFATGSAALIYAEHFFEHLDHPGPAAPMLRECHRILEPGGRLSLSVPGVEWHLERYVANDREWFDSERTSGQRPPWVETPIDSLNYFFRQDGEHRYAYDTETLLLRVAQAGFVDVATRDFDPELDSPDRRWSLCVDGRKPTD